MEKIMDKRISLGNKENLQGIPYRVIAPQTALVVTTDDGAEQQTQLLYGDVFTVYEECGKFVWGQATYDDYVGYVDMTHLIPFQEVDKTTHFVQNLRGIVYGKADIKYPMVAVLPLGAQVKVIQEEKQFSRTEQGWMITKDLLEKQERIRDFVNIAEQFLHSPYLWGGLTNLGIDCSGLIQTSLRLSGVRAMRDTDMQAKSLGEEVPIDSRLQRGDIIFWKGHVGVMQDSSRLLHANATYMKVYSENFKLARERIAKINGDIIVIRRWFI